MSQNIRNIVGTKQSSLLREHILVGRGETKKNLNKYINTICHESREETKVESSDRE